MVIKDGKSKWLAAHMVPRRGGEAYAITCLLREIEKVMGYKRMIFKSEQDPAIIDLKNKVKRLTKVDIMMEETPIRGFTSRGNVR